MRLVLVFVASASMLGCVTLNAAGSMVQYVTKAEAPKSCKFIGEIDVGAGGPGFQTIPQSAGETKILMRNEAAKRGGNFLVIDDINNRSDQDGSVSFGGSGRAYLCPQNELRPALAP